jgi:metal-responsive CopG/Arc/MetJ family transcriptional regulator
MKRILVSLPDGAWKIIEKKLKGKLGAKESELVRNIVIAYLSEKGYFEEEKNSMTDKKIKEIKEDVETLENMFSALVDILEKKKVISDRELDEQIKKKIVEEKKLKKFEDL